MQARHKNTILSQLGQLSLRPTQNQFPSRSRPSIIIPLQISIQACHRDIMPSLAAPRKSGSAPDRRLFKMVFLKRVLSRLESCFSSSQNCILYNAHLQIVRDVKSGRRSRFRYAAKKAQDCEICKRKERRASPVSQTR
jgi:hypothetical protein